MLAERPCRVIIEADGATDAVTSASLHRAATLVMSAAMAVLGVAILAVTLANGGGPLTLGFLLRRAVRRRRRRALLHHLAAPLMRFGRALGSPALFAIVWTSLASAIYFSLGIVAENALGLTPLVFLGAGVFFVLTAMTYVEGASMHPERAGATVFARYAFNELWSFIAGWAILLDFLILIAVTAFVATNYMAAFWAPLGERRAGARDRRRDHRLRRGAQHLRGAARAAARARRRARGRGHRAAAADHPRRRGARRRRRRADGVDRRSARRRRGRTSSSR